MNKKKISSLSLAYYTPVVILAAFLILPGVLGVIFINDTDNEFRDYVQNEQKVVTALNSLYANGLQMEQALRNIYINPADEKAVNSLEKAELNFADDLTIAEKVLSGVEGHNRLKNNLDAIDIKSEELQTVRKEILLEIYNGNIQAAGVMIAQNETPLWREVKSLILENLELEEAVIEEKLEHVSGQTSFASQLLIWLLAGGFIAGLLIIWYNSRKFLKPVKKLGIAAERINEIELNKSNGKLDLEIMVDRLVQKFDLLDELANPVMIVDKDFTIEYMNQSGAQFLKTDQKSLLGEKCYDWFQTDQCNTEDCATHMAMVQNNKAANKTIAHGGGRDTHINYASIPLRDKSGNVTGALEAVADINDFAEKINTLIGGIDDAVESNSSSSIQLSASAEELSQGAKQMSEQISDMASAIEEMSKTIFETAQNAEYAADAAKKAGRIAKDGGDVIDRTIESMNSIAEAVQSAVKTVHQLAESSKQISKVAQVINEIADQTNLLALNATIEAASAGESGKGFAVVANEIRELAKRTMNSTGEIEEIINKIQSVSDTVITQIEKGAAEVKGGKEMADKAGLALDDIIEATNAALDIVNQVAAASEQQSAASEEISKNIENIENITQQTAAGISQVAASAEDLNQRNDNLKKLTSDINI